MTETTKPNNMSYLFYLLTIVPLMWELTVVVNVQRVHRFAKAIKDVKAEDASSKQTTFTYFILVYFVWAFMGLFSTQWFSFVILFALSLIPKQWVFVRWLDAFISAVLLIFIVLNAFHFHLSAKDIINHVW